MAIEPLVYQTGFGMQNKDMILVRPKGCELLSDYLDTDPLLVGRVMQFRDMTTRRFSYLKSDVDVTSPHSISS